MNFFNQLLRAVLAVGMALLLGACATPASRAPGSGGYGGYGGSLTAVISPEQAVDVTIYAIGLVGTPYRYGGNTPDSGFDCSGLIGHVYKARANTALPRNVAGLQYWGQQIGAGQLRPGDLVLFGQAERATHAGIYVGEGRFVHAPSSGGEVRLDRLTSRYWSAQNAAYRRP